MTNAIYIAKECERMAGHAKGGDGAAFQKGAVVLMGTMVVASVAGVLLQIWKEWKHSAPHRQHIDFEWSEEPANDDQRRMHHDATHRGRSR